MRETGPTSSGNKRGPSTTGIRRRTILEETGPATVEAIENLTERVYSGLGPDGSVNKNLKNDVGIERVDGVVVEVGNIGSTVEFEDHSRWELRSTAPNFPTADPAGIAFQPGGNLLAVVKDGASLGTFELFTCIDYVYNDSAAIGTVTDAAMDFPVPRMQWSPDGRYCMVFGATNDFLTLVDCRVPSAPVVASTLDVSASTPADMTGSVWSTKRNTLYFCDGTSDDTIYSIDVAVPTDIEIHQTFSDTTNLNEPYALALSRNEDYLYVGQKGSVGVVNIQDPHELAWVENASLSQALDSVRGLDWQGNILAAYGADASEVESRVWNFEIVEENDITFKAEAPVSVGDTSTNNQDAILNGAFLSFWVSVGAATMYLVTFDVSSFTAVSEVQVLAVARGSAVAKQTMAANHVAGVYTRSGGADLQLDTFKCGRSSATSTANAQVRAFHSFQAAYFQSLVEDGLEPYLCKSRTLNHNLNAEFWNGMRPSDLTSKQFKSYNFSSRGVGAGTYFAGGYYEASADEVELDEGTLTDTLGEANVPYAAHVFFVGAGAGAVSGGSSGVATITITGTSIDDDGNRDAGGSEELVSDNTAVSTDEYFETTLKWLGTVTITIAQTGDRTAFDLTGNYGFAKYEDFGNRDFELTDFEAVGLAAASDGDFNVEILLHDGTGWTASAAAFVPGGTVIASMVGDHSTESDVDDTVHFAWKRVHLATEVNGTDLGGIVVRITTGANNTVQIMSVHMGVRTALL